MFERAHVVGTMKPRWPLHPAYMHTFGKYLILYHQKSKVCYKFSIKKPKLGTKDNKRIKKIFTDQTSPVDNNIERSDWYICFTNYWFIACKTAPLLQGEFELRICRPVALEPISFTKRLRGWGATSNFVIAPLKHQTDHSIRTQWYFACRNILMFCPGVTENYFVIVEQPLSLSLMGVVRNQLANKPLAASLQWYSQYEVSSG